MFYKSNIIEFELIVTTARAHSFLIELCKKDTGIRWIYAVFLTFYFSASYIFKYGINIQKIRSKTTNEFH